MIVAPSMRFLSIQIPRSGRIRTCLALIAGLGVGGGMRAAEAESEARAVVEDWSAVREKTFDLVWTTVHDAYFDPSFGGVDWPEVRSRYTRQLEEVADPGRLRELLQHMLDELGRSHFAIIARESAVFAPEERSRIGTVGLSLVGTPSEVTVSQVRPGSPAAEAGLKPGDVINAVDGRPLEGVRESVASTEWTDSRKNGYVADFVTSRLQAVVGTAVTLSVADAGGQVREVTLKTAGHEGTWSEPVGHFPSMPVELETRYEKPGVAYLRLSSFTPGLMVDVRKYLRALSPKDRLVLDLRGNRGGITLMASGIAGLLVGQRSSLGSMRVRRGVMEFEVHPQDRAFLGPVAVLIDNASASTSEILAAGLQEMDRARLFGEISAGAALPSSFTQLPTGDLFQFAIADVQTPKGHLIEGRGVKPDESIERTAADLASGQDPVLAAAVSWLEKQPGSLGSAREWRNPRS